MDSRQATLNVHRKKFLPPWKLRAVTSESSWRRRRWPYRHFAPTAYIMLASETAQAEEALTLYRQAVEAGAQAVGKSAFEADVGHFWALIETRPYMRARFGLARRLWESGQRDEAIVHYQDMLRLNPNDNQGVRYSLIDSLLELGHDGQAAELLKRYKDDESAAWTWSGALLSFRQNGDAPLSRKAVERAVDSNPHVPAYLLGMKALPRSLPEFIGLGDEDEAIAYVRDADAAWQAAEGAKPWIAAVLPAGTSAGSNSHRQRGTCGPRVQTDRIDDAALALLFLGLHDDDRAWKTFDWEVMDRLHEKGLISNPRSRTKFVIFTEKGLRSAEDLYNALFIKDLTKQP
jgi:hypothetical protein